MMIRARHLSGAIELFKLEDCICDIRGRKIQEYTDIHEVMDFDDKVSLERRLDRLLQRIADVSPKEPHTRKILLHEIQVVSTELYGSFTALNVQ